MKSKPQNMLIPVSKLYDRLFWASLFTSIVCFCAGCESLHAIGLVATTPDPATGATPLGDLSAGAGTVLLNPLSWPGWAQIAGAATTIGGGYAAWRKTLKKA